jgi:hypothetical protein
MIANHLSETLPCSDPFSICHADLSNYHLVNKAFADIDAAPLLSSLRFRASKHSLTRMRNINSSSSPTSLVRYVKELNFATTLYARDFEGMNGFALDTSAEELVDYSIFAQLVEGFVGVGAPITTLRTEKLPYSFEPNAHSPTLAASFANITDISFEFQCLQCGEDEAYDAINKTGAFRRLLASLKNLESLYLTFGWDRRMGCGPGRIEPKLRHFISSGHVWPQLRSLGLKSMDVAAEPFLQLLRIHKDTLKHLDLGCLSLFGDSHDDAGPGWKYVFEQAQEVLSLETASVVGSLQGGEGVERTWGYKLEDRAERERREKLERYLVHGGQWPALPS